MNLTMLLVILFTVGIPTAAKGKLMDEKKIDRFATDKLYAGESFPDIRVLSDSSNVANPIYLAIVTSSGTRTSVNRPPKPSPVTNVSRVTYYPSKSGGAIATYSMFDLMKFQVTDPPSSGIQWSTLRLPIGAPLRRAISNGQIKELFVVFGDKEARTINVQAVALADIKREIAKIEKKPSEKPSEKQDSVGVATMDQTGVIRLQLRSIDHGMIAEALKIVRPDDADYESLVKHLGGLKPGESKPIPPFDEN